MYMYRINRAIKKEGGELGRLRLASPTPPQIPYNCRELRGGEMEGGRN